MVLNAMLGDEEGIWIETEHLNMKRCDELHNLIKELFYAMIVHT